MKAENTQDLIQQQIAYYKARAPEYDEWLLRQGRYDRGEERNRAFTNELGIIAETLEPYTHVDDILELAAGTGWWTGILAKNAGRVTAVDAAAEAITINKEKHGSGNIEFVQADLFNWKPDRKYDLIYMGFWLSHVPPEKFDSFWEMAADSLKPGGKVFIADTLHEGLPTVAAGDDHLKTGETDNIAIRFLNDGSKHIAVKVFYTPEELTEKLKPLGWDIKARTTGDCFLMAWGSRAK